MTSVHTHPFRISDHPVRRLAAFRLWTGVARRDLALSAVMLLTVRTARAAGSSMPWETPLQSILDSVQGPVAKIVAVLIIISTGLALAFGDTSGGFRKLIQIVFGLSIAFAASSFFLSFFSFSGGAVV
ncbi:TrbC/VirB2 family protein [Chitinasiproducens palmae]|uniref:Type IV secretion system protein VirB2 n=1 Tax=Chitinasiproducens palmae TaxID=1770053 RepID=A0A1H2PUI4_9BURK|nr:TrbC/VirB2 family protein [Chitinasiproducens palmae]SDV50833.1 type IV secretion system protein VirB2 [Chitinasiproducens palmae]